MINPLAAQLPDPRSAEDSSAGPERAIRGSLRTNADGLVAGSPPASPSGTRGNNAQGLETAAVEFESLLLTQILRGVREAAPGGWLGAETGASSATMELAEAQFARALAQQGGLGLADLLGKNMARAPGRSDIDLGREKDLKP